MYGIVEETNQSQSLNCFYTTRVEAKEETEKLIREA